jgi:hypothetical protein
MSTLATALDLVAKDQVDERLSFLAVADAMYELVESGELDLDDAIAELASTYGGILCTCNRKLLERWERLYPPRRGRR